MISLFKSKEEKLLKEYEPAIVQIIQKQVHSAFESYVDNSEERTMAFTLRYHSNETYAYIDQFVESYCSAILPEKIRLLKLKKIIKETRYSVRKLIAAHPFLRKLEESPLRDLVTSNNPEGVPDFVIVEDNPTIQNAMSHATFDCARLILYDTFPSGLKSILTTDDWENPSPPKSLIDE